MQHDCRETKTPGNKSWGGLPCSQRKGGHRASHTVSLFAANRKSRATRLLNSPDMWVEYYGLAVGKHTLWRGDRGLSSSLGFPDSCRQEGIKVGNHAWLRMIKQKQGGCTDPVGLQLAFLSLQRPGLFIVIPYYISTVKVSVLKRKAFHLCPVSVPGSMGKTTGIVFLSDVKKGTSQFTVQFWQTEAKCRTPEEYKLTNTGREKVCRNTRSEIAQAGQKDNCLGICSQFCI